MSGPFFVFLLRRHWWTCGLCALIPLSLGLMVGAFFPTMESERKVFGPMLDLIRNTWFPDLPDFLSPAGAFVWPYMHPMTIAACALAPAIVALAQPAGLRGQGSLDLLLATPLSRTRLVGTVCAFMVPVAMAMGLGPLLGSILGALRCEELASIPVDRYLLCSVAAAALTMFFGSIALLISCLARDRGQATFFYTGFVLLSFVVNSIAQMWKDVRWIESYGPIGYYHPLNLANGEPVPFALDLTVLLGGSVVATAAALRWSARRRSA